MTQKGPIPDLSESFLHFLDDEKFNKGRKTYCNEKSSNAYHDSSYRWCKSCDKIFCTRCSLIHLLNNQISHTPIEKVFLSKEHLDVELGRDSNKLNDLKKNIDNFFSNNKKGLSQQQYNTINASLQKFKDFIKELFNIIDNFQKKLKTEIDNIEKTTKNFASTNLRENYVKSAFTEISNKFINIENNYCKNKDFQPTQMKSYYDELSEAYDGLTKLYDLVKSNSSKVNYVDEINSEYDKVKNKLIKAIDFVNNCSNNMRGLLNEEKL